MISLHTQNTGIPNDEDPWLDGKDFFVVGLGASAGGLLALTEFFDHMPAATGIAFVIVLQLSPDYESKLQEVLQSHCSMPIIPVENNIQLIPDRVYLVRPDRHLTMIDGHLSVSTDVLLEERRAPVDTFFRTLADAHGTRAIAVILSGTGANGSMGLKHIKERGGAVFVQSPTDAEFNEMPRNAITTGLVDEVLPVQAIPAKIIAYKNGQASVYIPSEVERRQEDQQHALRDVFTQLRLRTGHDFSNYKRPTLLRRIERRINVRNLPDLPAYAAFLRDNPDETTALLKDLLISVTNFFRDKKAFDVLETEVLPQLLEEKTSEHQLRIWVAGCATGEEAYSVAMLCAEKTLSIIDAPKVQIFATDIDEAAIAHAREGYYSINDAADVSPERLRRFFVKEGEGYRIQREIREMILFATHNFLKDPPFSHLDLVTCRNVLIYLNHPAQQRVMETFHFALKPGGFLFLGSSESADGSGDMYAIFSRDQHIFQSRQVSARSYPMPESVPAFRFEQPSGLTISAEKQARSLERITFGDLHQQLLEQYAPPSLVINEEYDVVHLSERAGRYLQVAGGDLSKNLLKLVRPELRLELRSALYQAAQRLSAVEARGLPVTIEDRPEMVNIHVRPVLQNGDTAKGFILILFEQILDLNTSKEVLLRSDEPLARQLEEELIRLKAQLRTSIEQHEFQAEELKASNEELQAMNEELRSAAEELETSKEELQSMNEELRTVNQELKVKIEETTLASNNLQNLINSVDIGTIFLDRSFRVALFTPAARKIFNLIPADHGRPLSDITHRLEYDDIIADAEIVLDKLQTVEKEVRTTDDHIYIMRVLPYRTAEDRINGVVVTFVDVTISKQAELAMRQSELRYRSLFNSMDEGYCIIQVLFDNSGAPHDLLYLDANPAFDKHSGLDNVTGKTLKQMVPSIEQTWLDVYGQVASSGKPLRFADHSIALGRTFDLYAFAIGEPGDNKVAVLFTDITARVQTENALQESEEKYRGLFEAIDEGFAIVERVPGTAARNTDYRFLEVNPIFEKRAGLRGAIGKTLRGVLHSSDQDLINHLAGAQENRAGIRIEVYSHGLKRWLDIFVSPFSARQPDRLAMVFNDITDRKTRETSAILLSEISEDLVRLTAPQAIMQTAMAKLAQACAADRVLIVHNSQGLTGAAQGYTYDLQSTAFTTIDGQLLLDKYLPANVQAALKSGRILIPDINKDEALRPYLPFYAQQGLRAVLLQPVTGDNEWCFLVMLQYESTKRWNRHERELIHDITHRLYFRMERAVAEVSTAADLRDMQLLRDLSTSMIMEGNIQALYDQVITVAIRILGANAGTVHILDDSSRILMLLAQDGISAAMTDYLQSMDAASPGPAGLALTSGERILSRYREQKILTPIQKLATAAGFGISLSTPLVTRGGKVIGMIKTFWKEEAYVASDRELRFLDLLTRQAADLIEYRRAELSLRESETRFRTLTNAIPQIIWACDRKGDANFFNEQWFIYTGMEQVASVGNGWQDVIHPEDAYLSVQRWQEALHSGCVFEAEYRIRRSDGIYRWHIVRSVPLSNKEGIVQEWFGSATDVEDLKMTQELLRESKERLHVTMESVTDYAIITLNAAGLVEAWNSGATKIFGYQSEEMIGRSLDVIYTPEDVAALVPGRERQQALTELRAADERWHCRKDGSLFFMSGVLMPIDAQASSGYVKVARDMTDYKAAEEALRLSEERYRAALQAAQMAAWDWDITVGKVTWNDEHFLMLGLSPDGLPKDVGFFLSFVHPNDAKTVREKLFNAVNTNTVYDVEFRIIRQGGEVRWVTGYGRTVAWKEQQATRMVGVMYDITERKMLEQQKEEFIGIASHELKTPITSIKVYVEVLQDLLKAANDLQSLELVVRLDNQIDRLTRLINDLLDNTRISEGHLVLQQENIDLNQLVQERIDDMRHTAVNHEIVFEAGALPLVHADRERIDQVMINLLANAIKYSPEGGLIKIDTRMTGGMAEVSVQDHGIGIPESQLHRVFERFFRVSDARMHSFPGMGLGLYISAGIVARHGGAMRVESAENKGTTFYFSLPITSK